MGTERERETRGRKNSKSNQDRRFKFEEHSNSNTQARNSFGVNDGRSEGLLWYKDYGHHVYGDFSMAVVQANNIVEDQSQLVSGLMSTIAAASMLLIGSSEELGVRITVHQMILPLIEHHGKGLCSNGIDVVIYVDTQQVMASTKNEGFSLTSGDFPTLGSERDNSGKDSDSRVPFGPEYKDRDFYISGENYVGHFAPQLAHTILYHKKNTNNTHINLNGIIIGNAMINDKTNKMGMYDYSDWCYLAGTFPVGQTTGSY